MRARGQGLLAIAAVVVLVGGAVAAHRAGPKPRPAASPGLAPSGSWICPHGGGPGWTTTIYLANPSSVASSVRITSMGNGPARVLSTTQVAAGATVGVPVPSPQRDSATAVDWFGGSVYAGWVAVAGGAEQGVTAEPCGAPSDLWYVADGSTSQGSEATYLVISNPSAATAVFSVVLFAADRAPIRESSWTDLVLRARSSTSLLLDHFAVNEPEVAAEIDVSTGRVGAATIGISKSGGVRTSLGATSLSGSFFLPIAGATGQSELVVLAPAQSDVTFDATLLSGEAVQPAGGLTDTTQTGGSAKAYSVITSEASSIDVQTQNGGMIAAGLRAHGKFDTASTGGATAPSISWVVMPTVGKSPAKLGLVLVNPGSQPAVVTLHVLAAPGQTAPADVTVQLGPQSVASAPAAFLSASPHAAVLVISPGVPVLALGASTSSGTHGVQGYAMSMGVVAPVAVNTAGG
jgi:hypothetical protein